MISITISKRIGPAEITLSADFDEPIPEHERSRTIRQLWAAFRREERQDERASDGRQAVDTDAN